WARRAVTRARRPGKSTTRFLEGPTQPREQPSLPPGPRAPADPRAWRGVFQCPPKPVRRRDRCSGPTLGTEEEGWHDNAFINPSTVCYCESSGILKLTRSPPSSNSIFAIPPRPWLTSRSIKVRPKPCTGGLPTGGPPRSTKSNTRLSPLRLSIAQETSSDPPAVDREPYLTEFVPSSWTIMPRESASFGLSETAGPSMTTRSSRPVR